MGTFDYTPVCQEQSWAMCLNTLMNAPLLEVFKVSQFRDKLCYHPN